MIWIASTRSLRTANAYKHNDTMIDSATADISQRRALRPGRGGARSREERAGPRDWAGATIGECGGAG